MYNPLHFCNSSHDSTLSHFLCFLSIIITFNEKKKKNSYETVRDINEKTKHHALLNLCEILLHPISFYDSALGVLQNFQQSKRDIFAQQCGFYEPSKIKMNLSEEN